jgi:hypothetical protein
MWREIQPRHAPFIPSCLSRIVMAVLDTGHLLDNLQRRLAAQARE